MSNATEVLEELSGSLGLLRDMLSQTIEAARKGKYDKAVIHAMQGALRSITNAESEFSKAKELAEKYEDELSAYEEDDFP